MSVGKLKDPVYLLGAGCTKSGSVLSSPEIKGLSLVELAAIAVKEAADDAGMDLREIDSLIVGNYMPQSTNMNSLYTQVSKWIGMELKAGIQVNAACSTTSVAATLAASQIASGAYENVLVVGMEITTNAVKGLSPFEREGVLSPQMWFWTDFGAGQMYDVPQGYEIFPVYNAIMAQGYARKYGLSIEEFDRGMMELCRSRRYHGSLTPKALIQETLEDEATRLGFNDLYEFWSSSYNPFMAWPSRLRSAVSTCDGATAMIFTNKERAAAYHGTPVELMGWGIAMGDTPWYTSDPTDWPMEQICFQQAYEMSGITVDDIDYMHVHDNSHISGVLSSEASGYIPKGKTLEYAREGRLNFDGDRPMTTCGGRHAFGQAWAACAGADVYEAVNQIRGRADKRQIKKTPEIALVHNHGYAMLASALVLKGGM